MNKQVLSKLLFFMIVFQNVPLVVAAQVPSQQGWISGLISGGIDLVKQGVGFALLATLTYKAQEYDLQKQAADNAIAVLQEKLKKVETEQEKDDINAQIKEQEAIRDQKKTLGQKVAQVILGLLAAGFITLAGATLWHVAKHGSGHWVDSAGLYHWHDHRKGFVEGTQVEYDVYIDQSRKATEKIMKEWAASGIRKEK